MKKEPNVPKILAMYLPQFHETEDNNRFWGKGFTDWKAAQLAEQYFPEHCQPRVPLGGNYYDLSKKEIMIWQAKLAKEYGVFGFCFYHYYFKDGKMELELPAENLLRWKDIDIHFCFDWDNSPWIRTWSKINGNIWSDKFDEFRGDSSREVLVEQDYESRDLWNKHFDYLLPFFRDERYIKINDRPVFIIHYPAEFDNLDEMIACWNQLGQTSGFAGIYFIGVNYDTNHSPFDAVLFYEPANSFPKLIECDKYESLNGVRCFHYADLCKAILETAPSVYKNSFFCAVTRYDNTPRVGRDGNVVIDDSPSLFQKNLVELLRKSMRYRSSFVFVDAWNEWGEGMYLEPDEQYGHKYLVAIKESLSSLVQEEDDENVELLPIYEDKIKSLDFQLIRLKYQYNLLDKWMALIQQNRLSFKDYLLSENVKSVAIYGMASLGYHLLSQLNDEGIEVKFGIDRQIRRIDRPFKIYLPDDMFPHVDAIIVTAYQCLEVIEFLKQKFDGKIITLQSILDFYFT